MTAAERRRLVDDAADLEIQIAKESSRIKTIRSRAHRGSVRVTIDALRLRLAEVQELLGVPS